MIGRSNASGGGGSSVIHDGSDFFTVLSANTGYGGISCKYTDQLAEISGYFTFSASLDNWGNRAFASISAEGVEALKECYSDQHCGFGQGNKLVEIILDASGNTPVLSATNMTGSTLAADTQIKFNFTCLLGEAV